MSSTSVSDDSNNNPNKDKLDSKKNEISTERGKRQQSTHYSKLL